MPDLMTAILFEKNERALIVRRRTAPFAGKYVLPIVRVGAQEAAEEAMRRHARDQFGLTLEPDTEAFVETVYLSDGDAQYVANVFRAQLPDGSMRFNAEGDYDDARWIAAADLDGVEMPPDMRIPLAKILTDPDALHELDWDTMGRELTTQAVPLGDRSATAEMQPATPAPDNTAGWDAIAKAYQDEIYGDRFGTSLMWSWSLSEEDLRLLDDVSGKRAIVLGCGGGQDVVALDKLGAIAVGIDASAAQIAYARKFALKNSALNSSFAEGSVDNLSRFDDDSFDLAVSAHALNYVEHIEDALRETARVLKGGASFTLSVRHPFDTATQDDRPFATDRPYWNQHLDWTWNIDKSSTDFRQWFWTISQWCEMLQAAGFSLERILEPEEPASTAAGAEAAKRRLVPYTLILKARKR